MLHRILIVALVPTLVGCMPDNEPPAAPPVPPALPPNSNARDFFPIAIGSRWTYEVTLTGDAPPLLHTEIERPIGLVADRGVPWALRDTPDLDGTHRLELSIQGRAEHDPNVLELTVDVDDLGLFAQAQQVYWTVSDAERFMAAQVTMHAGEGKATRMIYFGGPTGANVRNGGSSIESLHFRGVSPDAEVLAGQECLHFVRQVAGAPDGTPDELRPAFSEDTWFARGKGLVRLEQRVGDKLTMVWQLVEFTLGEGDVDRPRPARTIPVWTPPYW